MDADVIVVGASQTGLMLAPELGLAHLRVLVLERLPAPSASGDRTNRA
jgi:bifunctional hydroxylase/dehydrase